MTRAEAIEQAGIELSKAIAELGLTAPVATATVTEIKPVARRRRQTKAA